MRRILAGFHNPQGVVCVPKSKKVYVANQGNGDVCVYETSEMTLVTTISLGEEADNLRYCDVSGRVYVGYGDGAIDAIDVETDTLIKTGINLQGHPEGFQINQMGEKIYINVEDRRSVVSFTLSTQEMKEFILPPNLSANYPMAIDEDNEVIFVGVRRPPCLVVMDMNDGGILSTIGTGADTDDVFYDARRKRIYVVCGEGIISTIQQRSRSDYEALGTVRTVVGARTGLWQQERDRLTVAAPATDIGPARVLIFFPID